MTPIVPSVEEFSRAAKALVDGGTASSFQEATQILAQACPLIVVGPDAVAIAHQAALLTAVETTVRAFGRGPVHLPKDEATALICHKREPRREAHSLVRVR